ncbi:uncharacterized protein LOC124456947 [Xenia sp. Carnegie-2017]|uniref:uncharacterized protein LOC124456947 n=1 Tax=Xenia sp. Carnegie-2017 TaxID=2897299 RepID=UPI001F035794|nr:uncharacterized protein LOC124456947 [Xenia sp. Carnegie-2017]
MELEGLKRSFKLIQSHNLQVSHLITDRHCQVKKYMKTQQPGVKHYFDVWHVAKVSIFFYKYQKKKVMAAGKKSGCRLLLDWAQSISNHVYWCAASSGGDEKLLKAKWLSLLNHICNIHDGHSELFPKCEHGTLEPRLWIKKGTN